MNFFPSLIGSVQAGLSCEFTFYDELRNLTDDYSGGSFKLLSGNDGVKVPVFDGEENWQVDYNYVEVELPSDYVCIAAWLITLSRMSFQHEGFGIVFHQVREYFFSKSETLTSYLESADAELSAEQKAALQTEKEHCINVTRVID